MKIIGFIILSPVFILGFMFEYIRQFFLAGIAFAEFVIGWEDLK